VTRNTQRHLKLLDHVGDVIQVGAHALLQRRVLVGLFSDDMGLFCERLRVLLRHLQLQADDDGARLEAEDLFRVQGLGEYVLYVCVGVARGVGFRVQGEGLMS
jgi:hypothetical protein